MTWPLPISLIFSYPLHMLDSNHSSRFMCFELSTLLLNLEISHHLSICVHYSFLYTFQWLTLPLVIQQSKRPLQPNQSNGAIPFIYHHLTYFYHLHGTYPQWDKITFIQQNERSNEMNSVSITALSSMILDTAWHILGRYSKCLLNE